MSEPGQAERELGVFGGAIREIREQHGVGIDAVAAAVGIEPARLEAVEQGRLDPDYVLIVRVAEAVGVRAGEFFVHAEKLAVARL